MLSVGGLLIAVGGGVLSGLFTTPMNFMAWSWEASWFIYSVFGMVVFPWCLALGSVPELGAVYSAAYATHGISVFAKVALFGAGWGLGSVTFGLGTNIVGNSLGFSIILGATAAFGSLIPLLVNHPDDVGKPVGEVNFLSLFVTVLGLAVLAYAGVVKEAEQQQGKTETIESIVAPGKPKYKRVSDSLLQVGDTGRGSVEAPAAEAAPPSLTTGLLFCAMSGTFSPMLNLALAFGQPIADAARCCELSGAVCTVPAACVADATMVRHAAASSAKNAIWALAVGSGSIINLAYVFYRLSDERTWGELCSGPRADRSTAVQWDRKPGFYARHGSVLNYVYAIIMGLLWFGGNVLYGIGAGLMGKLGLVLGWPIFLCSMIITANVSGVLSGEWNGTTGKSRGYNVAGLLLLAVAVGIDTYASTLKA